MADELSDRHIATPSRPVRMRRRMGERRRPRTRSRHHVPRLRRRHRPRSTPRTTRRTQPRRRSHIANETRRPTFPPLSDQSRFMQTVRLIHNTRVPSFTRRDAFRLRSFLCYQMLSFIRHAIDDVLTITLGPKLPPHVTRRDPLQSRSPLAYYLAIAFRSFLSRSFASLFRRLFR